MKKIIFIFFIILSKQLEAQVLDPSFGTNGGIVTNLITDNPMPIGEGATNAALQDDGKTIIITSNKVIRLNLDNTLDTSFNTCGYRNIDNIPEALLIQPDGKILVAGLNYIYRINSNGSLDTSFGYNGSTSILMNNFNMQIKSIGLKSDGKIVLGGYISFGNDNDFAVSCLNPDGSFDSQFGVNGKITLDLDNQNNYGYAIAIQNDNKVVLTGASFDGLKNNMTTLRFETNGNLDTTFGAEGIVTTSIGTSNSSASSINIQNNGTIVIYGRSGLKPALIRYTSFGALDTTFGSNGILTSNQFLSIYDNYKSRLKALSNGKYLISYTGSSSNKFIIYQLNNDGSFDTSFGTNGMAFYDGLGSDYSTFLIQNTDNKIITGGYSYSSYNKIEKIQFSSSGTFESEYNFNIVYGSDSIFDIIEQSTGKTIASNGVDIYTKNTLVRYNTDGSIDDTFGTNGKVIPATPFSVIALQPDDKFIINNLDVGIIRYTSDGMIDSTFGVNGLVDFFENFSTPITVSFIDNLVVSSNGEIYVTFDYSADGTNCGPTHYGVLRLNPDGTLDTSFGINGYSKIAFDYYSTEESEYPQFIFEDSDGKLIITGIVGPLSFNMGQVGTARINNDGTLDTTFGIDGKVITSLGSFEIGSSILKSPNNKYIINSHNFHTTRPFTSLIQYNYDGTIDTTFGTNGILSDQQNYFDYLIQPDGKILCGNKSNDQFAIYRNNADGSLDTTFGTNGLLSTTISNYSKINKLLYLQNGKILAGGYAFNGTNQVFAQARYTFENLASPNEIKNNSFKLYPNPTTNQFVIDFGENKPINYHVKISNFLGQEVYHNSINTTSINIPITWTGKGLYFVTVYDETNTLINTEKLIVN